MHRSGTSQFEEVTTRMPGRLLDLGPKSPTGTATVLLRICHPFPTGRQSPRQRTAIRERSAITAYHLGAADNF